VSPQYGNNPAFKVVAIDEQNRQKIRPANRPMPGFTIRDTRLPTSSTKLTGRPAGAASAKWTGRNILNASTHIKIKTTWSELNINQSNPKLDNQYLILRFDLGVLNDVQVQRLKI
jgi:hypothetical protein